jgi:DNA ligase (NAD+)
VIYNDMPHISVPLSDFKQNYGRYEEQVRMSEYPIDGVVYEVIDSRLKVFMGSNSHHHHWQLAHKRKGESRVVVVEDIQYQVGKSGKITPVVIIPPTKLSGAVVTRLTGHHVGNILRLGIGVGAEIEAIRSGEIIPTITGCVKRADTIQVPDSCPCCQSEVEMRGDFLYCTSKNCSAQAVTTIIHHFKTIGALLFGTKTVEKLVEAGYVTIPDVYALTTSQLVDVGLGEGQAKNLYNEMRRVLSEPLDDFRLLASLGISDLGRGSSKKLLAHWRIHELNRINMSDIEGIYGFGEIVAAKIANALRDNQTFEFLLQSFSKLVHTQDEIARQENVRASSTSSMAGKKVVFSGTCTKSRSDMNAYAESVGCITQKSVTIDTDYLVCGENVGQSKLSNAEKKGVKVISEAEFRDKV